MRTFASLQVLATFDPDQVQKAFDQEVTFDDTDPGTASTTTSGLVTLAGAVASQAFPFGGVTHADTVLVIAYEPIQVQLGSNTAPLIDVRPVPANIAAAVTSTYQRLSQPGVLFLRGKLSSLFLTNPSATVPATCFVALVGEAT